jgi:hypothetical protein
VFPRSTGLSRRWSARGAGAIPILGVLLISLRGSRTERERFDSPSVEGRELNGNGVWFIRSKTPLVVPTAISHKLYLMQTYTYRIYIKTTLFTPMINHQQQSGM